jgi:hypothetical protein
MKRHRHPRAVEVLQRETMSTTFLSGAETVDVAKLQQSEIMDFAL